MNSNNISLFRQSALNLSNWSFPAAKIFCFFFVIFVIAGWRFIIYSNVKSLQKEARELVAIRNLLRNPSVSNAGDRVLYVQNTEEGLGVYCLNISEGSTKMLQEIPETRMLSSLYLLDWTPDDAHFAYARPLKGGKQEISIWNSTIEREAAKIPVEGLINELKWLSTNKLAYLNNSNHIYQVTRGPKGNWKQNRRFKDHNMGPMSRLVTVSSNKLAWKQDGAIWMSEINGSPSKVWVPPTNSLVSFDFSPRNNSLLITTTSQDGANHLLSLHLDSKKLDLLETLASGQISKAGWINNGEGYAFQCRDRGGESLQCRIDGSIVKRDFFPQGRVTDFKSRPNKIFIYGSPESGPRELWEYEINADKSRCLIASTEKVFSFYGKVTHTSGTVTNQSGLITFQVWRPSVISSRKKYPLIIGQTFNRWNLYPMLAARAGYYFVVVDRESWDERVDQWEEDVLSVYNSIKEANIDTNRVFLYGHSAETTSIRNLAIQESHLWKGALLLSPTDLPDLSRSAFSSLFIAAGEATNGVNERLSFYQREAAIKGVAVCLVINPEAMHTAWSKRAERKRAEALAEYLIKN